MRTCTFCLDISKYSISIVCGQGVQQLYLFEKLSAVSRFYAARGSVPIFDVRSYRHLEKCTVCHRRPRQDVWRVRVQFFVLVSYEVVYRYGTRAVNAAWGSVRYAIDARDRTSGVHGCSITF